MVSHDDLCESCGVVGRTSRMRWPDGQYREMCPECERQWLLIWRHFCEFQPRQANRVRAQANRDQIVTDGGRRETHIGKDGLFVPADLREFEGQIVFRTPRATIQHFGSQPLDAYYGLIDETHFGYAEDLRDPKNPDLAPTGLRVKAQGEEPVEFEVATNPEVRCDGGELSDDTNRFDNTTERVSGSNGGVAGSRTCGQLLSFTGQHPIPILYGSTGSHASSSTSLRVSEAALFPVTLTLAWEIGLSLFHKIKTVNQPTICPATDQSGGER